MGIKSQLACNSFTIGKEPAVVWPVVLTVITITVFFPTFFNDFQKSWDDGWMLLEQPVILNFSWEDFWYHCRTFYFGQYSPVNTGFYLAVISLFGFHAGAYHAACLVVHIINVLLAFFVIRAVIERIKPAWNAGRASFYAGCVALIFGVHPLQVESVAWISASKIVLYAFFSLLGLWFYLKYIRSGAWMWYTGVLLCYLLAFGSKEQAVIFPLNLILLDWAFGRYKSVSIDLHLITREVVLEKVPFFLFAAGMWYFSLQNNLGNINVAESYPFHQRLLFGSHSLMQYIFRFIAPAKLYYFYFYPVNPGEALPVWFLVYPVLVFVCGCFLWHHYSRKNRLVVFGCLLFLINILLVLHVLPVPRKMVTADRYMYFSIIGLGLSSVWLGHLLYLKLKAWRKALVIGFTAWILFLCVHSFVRTTEWQDSDSIKKNVRELIEKRKSQDKPVVNNPLKDKTLEKECIDDH